MRKYLRTRPQHEKEVISSEFPTLQEYLRNEKIKQEALERDRLLAEHLEQECYKRDCLEHKRIRQEKMLLQYSEFFSLNIFSNLEEFYEFVEDFYGKNWTSNHASKIFFDDNNYRYAMQDLALRELKKQPRPAVECPCHPSLSYERELTEKYLNGDIGEEQGDAELFGLDEFSDGDFYDVDTNEAWKAHLEEKASHVNRRLGNIRATNRRIRYSFENISTSFVLVNSRNKARECTSAKPAGFIAKMYEKSKRELENYNSMLRSCPCDDKYRLSFQNSLMPSLERKRYAETIRRFKSRIRLAKHYGSFSTEKGCYLKKETSPATSTSVSERPKDTKKIPMHVLDYVNHRFGKPCKDASHLSKKKKTETVIHIVTVPFIPCHIAPSFVKH